MNTRYPGTLLLAEANQWPSDLLPYFGNGDAPVRDVSSSAPLRLDDLARPGAERPQSAFAPWVFPPAVEPTAARIGTWLIQAKPDNGVNRDSRLRYVAGARRNARLVLNASDLRFSRHYRNAG